MKTLIRWLADVSGVTRDIQIESYKHVGDCMWHNHYWWNGGIMHGAPKWEVWNAFVLYSKHLRNGWAQPIGNSMMEIRSEVYKLGNKMIEAEEAKNLSA